MRNGASLAEVGQVLRQAGAATTAIYAKVDWAGLRALAQPWPGGGVMNALRQAAEDYLAVRRALGSKLPGYDRLLAGFAAWRLLLRFVHAQTGKEPAQLDLADLGAPVIGAFLEHLEQERGNSARTRNARLTAIRSFFRYAALRHPEHAGLIARVLAIRPNAVSRPMSPT